MTSAQIAQHGRDAMRHLDRVWIFFLVVLTAIFVAAPPQGITSLTFVANNLLTMAPYLLFAIAAAAYATATGADALIAKAFQGRVVPMIGLAAVFGAVSPFCSCGVIPLIAALLAMGVPLPPVMAFWLASPVIDPTQFMITWGALSLDFAIAKTLFAIMLGLIGGFGVLALAGSSLLADPLRPGIGNGGCGGAKMRNPKPPVWAFWQEPARREKFFREALKTTMFLVKWLSVAYLAESLFIAYVPAESVGRMLGGGEWWTIAAAGILGAPLYLNGYAAVPVAAGLMDAGMAPGAAMAFLVGGGVTSIPAAMAVWALARPRVFGLYLGLAATGAVTSGILYQLWTSL